MNASDANNEERRPGSFEFDNSSNSNSADGFRSDVTSTGTSSPEMSPEGSNTEAASTTSTTTSSSASVHEKRKKPFYEQRLDFDTDNKRSVRLERIAKTNKLLWTTELHQIFLHAIRKLGVNATPKEIRAYMNVSGLTRDNIASHLQKYRAKLRAAVTAEAMEALLKQEEELLAMPLSEGPITLVTKPKSRPKEKQLKQSEQAPGAHPLLQQSNQGHLQPGGGGSAFSQFQMPTWTYGVGVRGGMQPGAPALQVLPPPPSHPNQHLSEETYAYLMNPFLVNNSFMNPMINPMGAPAFPPVGSLGKLSVASGQPVSGASSSKPSILDYLAPFQTMVGRQQE